MTTNLGRRNIVWGALLASVVVLAPAARSGGVPQASPAAAVRADKASMYQMALVDRSVKAVKYAHRSGSTKIDFQGTDLMPAARGEAKVDGHRGAIEVKAEFSNVQKPTAFGAEYLTYVMWAISPEGRAVNLGEVLIGDDDRSKLEVTTDLQAFAMIVTAEPYYAVRRPSNVVVLENEIRPDTVGASEVVDAKFELIDRGGYIPTGYKFDPVVLNAKLPLEFFEARNAVRIAQSAGAQQYATASFDNATGQMKQADDMATRRSIDKKRLISTSRMVVQTAEDSREIAEKKIDDERVEAGRRADANRVATAKAETRSAQDQAADADRARADADRRASSSKDLALNAAAGQAQAERDTAAASAGRDQAERDSADADRRASNSKDLALNAAAGQAQAERDSAAASAGRAQAERDSAASAAGQAQAERDTANAQQGQQTAQAEADRNRAAAMSADEQLQKAVREREELRARLLVQFNTILETRDTARGLVVNMSDVLFDTAKFTLRPAAREKLAKISGIVLAYPSLALAIEGNTDSVGGDSYNQTLSENRAGSVRDYLVTEGIPTASMTARGFGKTQPVASNDTSDGRQQNRRVELVVSGEVIGTIVGTGPAAMEMLPVAPSPRQ